MFSLVRRAPKNQTRFSVFQQSQSRLYTFKTDEAFSPNLGFDPNLLKDKPFVHDHVSFFFFFFSINF